MEEVSVLHIRRYKLPDEWQHILTYTEIPNDRDLVYAYELVVKHEESSYRLLVHPIINSDITTGRIRKGAQLLIDPEYILERMSEGLHPRTFHVLLQVEAVKYLEVPISEEEQFDWKDYCPIPFPGTYYMDVFSDVLDLTSYKSDVQGSVSDEMETPEGSLRCRVLRKSTVSFFGYRNKHKFPFYFDLLVRVYNSKAKLGSEVHKVTVWNQRVADYYDYVFVGDDIILSSFKRKNKGPEVSEEYSINPSSPRGEILCLGTCQVIDSFKLLTVDEIEATKDPGTEFDFIGRITYAGPWNVDDNLTMGSLAVYRWLLVVDSAQGLRISVKYYKNAMDDQTYNAIKSGEVYMFTSLKKHTVDMNGDSFYVVSTRFSTLLGDVDLRGDEDYDPIYWETMDELNHLHMPSSERKYGISYVWNYSLDDVVLMTSPPSTVTRFHHLGSSIPESLCFHGRTFVLVNACIDSVVAPPSRVSKRKKAGIASKQRTTDWSMVIRDINRGQESMEVMLKKHALDHAETGPSFIGRMHPQKTKHPLNSILGQVLWGADIPVDVWNSIWKHRRKKDILESVVSFLVESHWILFLEVSRAPSETGTVISYNTLGMYRTK